MLNAVDSQIPMNYIATLMIVSLIDAKKTEHGNQQVEKMKEYAPANLNVQNKAAQRPRQLPQQSAWNHRQMTILAVVLLAHAIRKQ